MSAVYHSWSLAHRCVILVPRLECEKLYSRTHSAKCSFSLQNVESQVIWMQRKVRVTLSDPYL